MKYLMCLLAAAGIVGILFLLGLFFDWLKHDAPEWVKMVLAILCGVFMLSLLIYMLVG